MKRAREKQAAEPVEAEGDGAASAEASSDAQPAGDGALSPLLEILIRDADAGKPAELPSRIDGVVVGRLARVDASGPWVELVPGASPIAARAIAPATADDAGREVALMFEGGDPSRPLVMGLVQRLAPPREEAPPPQPLDVQRDGERVVLSADKEIVLSCGEASITLTRAGKILIRGAYVSTRASGVNRIVGGTVEIN